MPILGLSDQKASLPRIGELRKGAPKPEGGIGADLTYFRFTSTDEKALSAFEAAYGPEPTEINVYLPYATAAENFESWMERHGAGSLKTRCDGETIRLHQTADARYSDVPKACACTALPDGHPERCKPAGRLYVLIPELQRMAFVWVLTGSVIDIRNLSSQLLAYEIERGNLRGIPFVLRRSPQMISRPGGGKKARVRDEKWMLSIEAHPAYVARMLEDNRQRALPGTTLAPRLLSGPVIPESVDVVGDGPGDEAGFFALTGEMFSDWDAVLAWWGENPPPKPTTAQEWADLYEAVRPSLAADVTD